MYQNTTIGVVVPAYNEAGFVGDVIDTIPEFVDRIYAVDDASTDETWDEICERAEKLNTPTPELVGDGGTERRVVPIQHSENRGVGGAIKTGYQHALADGIEVVTVMGADGQMDPDLIDRIIDPVVDGRADYAKGNRLLLGDHYDSMPRFRYVGNVALTYLTRIASGYWELGDPQNGYTAISDRALEAADIDEMYEFYGYCNDLLVKLNVADMRVVDVPTPAVYGEEESHISYSSYIPRVSGMLFRNFLWRLRAKYVEERLHPVALCYALGGGGLVAGVLGGFLGLVSDVSVPAPALFGFGLLFLLVAMALDKRSNEHLTAVVSTVLS
ncbi:glycosyltransferase family 2 protein [Halosimplex salinum]|uniref:glycosyltransferase family 2 protein n=1 Tax=Halosimplex salinum TaxID=1710538 RepID=UPI000F4ACDCC|nr:glycosyltransferase family 2 protein [Halosimplex salinum]